MTIEDKLGVDKFHTDEINSHIEVDKESTDMEEIQKVIKACPAGLYKLDDENHLLFDHLGCLECGTCRSVEQREDCKGLGISDRDKRIEYRMG